MPTGCRLRLLLLLYLAVLLVPSGAVSIIETTEARYAEIAREMIATGDFLEPRLNGILHFHKPPLPYWMVAAGFRLFGQNNFGARFFGIVFACLAVLYLHRTARVLLRDDRKAFHAALVFATSLLFLVVARVASTEIYLVFFTVASQFHLFRRVYGERRASDAPLFGLFLALGFLTKGHILFAFTLLPYLALKIFDRSHRSVFRPAEILAGTGVFLAVALPWYLLVAAKNPGLLPYFFKVHTVDRIATDRFHRYQPFWYFLYVLAGTFVPYVFFLVRGMGSVRRLAAPMKALAVYIVLPLLVFSAVKGKHATYIAPLYGVLAVFTAESLAVFPAPRLRLVSVGLMALLAAAPGVAGFVVPALKVVRFPLLAASAVALLMVRRAHECRSDDRFLHWTAAALLFLATIGTGGYALGSREERAYETMTAAINRLDPRRSRDVLVYRGHLPSVSFYRGKLAAMAFGMPREVQFEKDEAWRDIYIDSPESLGRYLSSRKDLFVVTSPGNLDSLLAEHPMNCAKVFDAKRFSAYRCGRE
jgi:4-amino-4-deoxy-L-arabinose transferase-like glycosyltransferase